MEVNRGARKHPHPDDHYQIQGHVQQAEHHPGECRETGCFQGRHRCRFLHDEEGRVGQDEGVSWDVVAAPVEAGPPAAGFGYELLVDNIQGVGFITRAGRVLDVEEGLGADIPDGCGHRQRQQPPAEEGHTPAEGGVGEEEEGGQQQQRPPPGHFDKIHIQGVSAAAEICLRDELELLQGRARHRNE